MRRPIGNTDLFGGQKPLLEKDTVLGEVARHLDVEPEAFREEVEHSTLDQIAERVTTFAVMLGVSAYDLAELLYYTVGSPSLAAKLDDDIN